MVIYGRSNGAIPRAALTTTLRWTVVLRCTTVAFPVMQCVTD
jgi:hypothetical protein